MEFYIDSLWMITVHELPKKLETSKNRKILNFSIFQLVTSEWSPRYEHMISGWLWLSHVVFKVRTSSTQISNQAKFGYSNAMRKKVSYRKQSGSSKNKICSKTFNLQCFCSTIQTHVPIFKDKYSKPCDSVNNDCVWLSANTTYIWTCFE